MTRNTLLDGTGLSPAVCDLVIDRVSSGSGEFRLVLDHVGDRGKATAIQNDEFKVLQTSATLVAGFLASASIAVWAPAAIAGLVVFLYEFRKKQIVISARQAAILRELKSQGSATAADIVEGLDMRGIDEPRVVEELETLSRLPRHDGKMVSLVISDAKGRWHVQDV
jgi:hypothetical protein